MDTNHHLQSIGLYICGEENINHYIVFFTYLLKAGIIDKDYIVLMTDFGTYFEEAIKSTFMEFKPDSFRWCLCCQHYKRDLAHYIDKHYPHEDDEDAEVFQFCEQNLYLATRAGSEISSKIYLNRMNE